LYIVSDTRAMSDGRPVTRIAVIGVGSAGLAALKQAVDAFSRAEVASRTRLELVGFETRNEVGGLWYVCVRPIRGSETDV
jgi:cation diffusion facilitator CzcD-associated flavoprotein CzcO